MLRCSYTLKELRIYRVEVTNRKVEIELTSSY